MVGRRLSLALLPAAVAALAGCGGQGAASQTLDLGSVPLVDGTTVVAQSRQCDRGANAYCALEVVVVNPHFQSSDDFVKDEQLLLRTHRWSIVGGYTGDETAAESPGHKLRLTYATASGDLKGIDLVWIQRSPEIALALSRVMFDRDSAMSLMLESGPS
jgi:hypothetical protein